MTGSDLVTRGFGYLAMAGGFTSALVGFATEEPAQAVSAGAFWVGLSGVVGVILSQLAPFIRSEYEIRKMRAQAQIDLNRARLASDEKIEMARAEAADKRHALAAKLDNLSHDKHLNEMRLADLRAVVLADREWMRRVSEQYRVPLPDGFGERTFDLRTGVWEDLATAVEPEPGAKPEPRDDAP